MPCSNARRSAPESISCLAGLRTPLRTCRLACLPALITAIALLIAFPVNALAQLGQSVAILDEEGTVVMELDRSALEAVGTFVITTGTPWDDGVVRYEGPLLRDLMAHAGMDNTDIEVVALNEYTSIVPHHDIRDIDVILAIRRNGEYMPVSDKGPAFILYPYDSSPRLQDRIYYARSVWQVARIRPAQDTGAQ
jgi:hypothetical protein